MADGVDSSQETALPRPTPSSHEGRQEPPPCRQGAEEDAAGSGDGRAHGCPHHGWAGTAQEQPRRGTGTGQGQRSSAVPAAWAELCRMGLWQGSYC